MQSMEEKVRIVFVGGSVGWGWSAAGAADNKCQIYLLSALVIKSDFTPQ